MMIAAEKTAKKVDWKGLRRDFPILDQQVHGQPLIYFDNASRRRVIEMFYERLLPGGYLLLGHSESLLNVSTAFELVHLSEDLVYRKPLISMAVRSGGGS